MSNFDTIIRQRRRIEELEEEVRQLRELDNVGVLMWAVHFDLTKTESKFFELLVSREVVTYEVAIAFVFDGAHLESPDNLSKVYIHKLRKKLQPYRVDIDTIWGHGWKIPPEQRRRLLEMKSSPKAANDNGVVA